MQSFNRVDHSTAAALHRMQSAEMEPLLTFINKMLTETKTALITAEPEHFRRLQGRAGFIKEFLDAVEQSAATLEKLQ